MIVLTCASGTLCGTANTLFVADTHPGQGIMVTSWASLMLLVALRIAGVAVDESVIRSAETLSQTEVVLLAVIERRSQVVMLGTGGLYGIARGGAPKLQEMSIGQF